MIKLIVTDLDGTLLTEGGISKKNLEAINYAKEKGAELVLATGRDFSMITDLIEKYNLSNLSITGNGAEFRDHAGNLVVTEYLDVKHYKDVVNIFLKRNIPFMVYTTNGFYSEQDPDWVRDCFLERGKQRFGARKDDEERQKFMPCFHLVKINDTNQFLATNPNIIKIEAFTINDPEPINKIKEEFKSLEGISYLSSYSDNLEVTTYKAQKGIILEDACQILGIKKDEVIVLGDGMNDISMFERFKYSFAPANATQELLDIAYKVVASCNDDGFAEAIYEIIK